MIIIAEASTPQDFAAVRMLLREYFTWAFELTERSSTAPTYSGFEAELETLPGPYARPGGRLLIARVDSQPAGCVALKPRGTAGAELKRLYVRPQHRGMKIGRRLVTTLLDEARAAGYRRIALDSHVKMTSAHAIYRGVGFSDEPAPGDFPEFARPFAVFMGLTLDS